MSNGYVLIENTPGYLPDNEPLEYDTLEEAKQGLRDEIARYLDDFETTEDRYDSEISSDGMSAYVCSRREHDLGVSFEIEEVHG